MVNADDLRNAIAVHQEWLLIRELGKTFPLECHEIDAHEADGKVHFGFIDDQGFHSWRLNGFEPDGEELRIDVAGAFAQKRETMRLVPRTSASLLAAEVEIARLKIANEIAGLVADHYPKSRTIRVALSNTNGRLAQITFELADKTPLAAIADVTNTMTVETLFTAGITWVEKLGLRKQRPISELKIICEKRTAKNAQKLHALLNDTWKAKLSVLQIDRKTDPPKLVELAKRKIRDLWREKPQKLGIPPRVELSTTAEHILALAPDEIDVVFSKQGETLRFNGIPFARVRKLLEKEKAWFGVGANQRILLDENFPDLAALVAELSEFRRGNAENSRHEYYRTGPEAWLESILRRNIRLLDANLILSPIYNQFRFAKDKIDLLAIRRDGRLVIIELKTKPDREMVFQAADYWRKIEHQRRRGILANADLFDGREILDKPALVYLVAPAWSFHRDYEFFAKMISPEIELWRWELHETWREAIRVVARHSAA